MMIMVEQDGKDCVVTIGNDQRRLKDCDALKLMNTLFNKPFGEHYSREQMYKMGFMLKKEVI